MKNYSKQLSLKSVTSYWRLIHDHLPENYLSGENVKWKSLGISIIITRKIDQEKEEQV